jgi:hypothetical protein
MQYADDPKRVFNWRVRDATPMREIEPRILEEFSIADGVRDMILKKTMTSNWRIR